MDVLPFMPVILENSKKLCPSGDVNTLDCQVHFFIPTDTITVLVRLGSRITSNQQRPW